MIGIAFTSLPAADRQDPFDGLAAAARLGMQAVLLPSLAKLTPNLDAGLLREVRAAADHLGLALGGSAGTINPRRPATVARLVALGAGDAGKGLLRLAQAAASIGITELFFVVGMIEDRFDREIPWEHQLASVAALLASVAPQFRALGCRLLVKTHEEINSHEILSLIERVGGDLLGVALDPVNVLCRMEDPVACTARLQRHVRQIHVDDAMVRFEGKEMRRYLCDIGRGVIDWSAILRLLPGTPCWVELHRGQFAMPVFERAWVDAQPDLVLSEYVSVLGHAAEWGDAPVPFDQSAPEGRLRSLIDGLRALRP